MAFFNLSKKKREDTISAPMPSMDSQPEVGGSPMEQVISLKQQGYTNGQITQMLQGQGYSTGEIYNAINQANLSGPQSVEQPEAGMQDYGQSYQSYQQPSPPQFEPPGEYSKPYAESGNTIDDQKIQEITEAVIEEKWQEFANDIKKVIDWKDRSEDRLAKIEQQLIDLRMGMDSLTKSILSKISSYDQNILDVGTEIKAMEKVFQKVLPSLTENVNKLDRMSKGFKEPQQPAQQKR